MATYRVRVIDKTEDGGVITLVCVDDDQSVWTSTANGTPGGDDPPDPPSVLSVTRLLVLDIPLLRVQDDYPGVYMAAAGVGSNWPGCEVFRSIDGGVNYESLGTIERASTMGIAESDLQDWKGGNTVDTCSYVDVLLNSGTLATASFDSFMGGANHALIGDEIVRFRSAELLSAGRYRLTGFMRGMHGTDWAMGDHSAGKRFVLLDHANMIRVPFEPSRHGSETIYRGVTLGAALTTGLDNSIYDGLVSSRPLSPILLFSVVESGGTTYAAKWTRRTRYPSTLVDGVGAPVGERSESYRVLIADGAVTIQDTTQAATSIAGIPKSDYYPYPTISVAQVSDVVGTGTAAESYLPTEDF